MIYAIQILDGEFVKIGFSSNDDVEARLASLQTGSPFKLEPVFTITGTLRQEQTVHALLSRAFHRIHVPTPPNEWYPGRVPMFSGFLEYLRYGFEPGIAYLENFDPTLKLPGKKGDHGNINKWPSARRKIEYNAV